MNTAAVVGDITGTDGGDHDLAPETAASEANIRADHTPAMGTAGIDADGSERSSEIEIMFVTDLSAYFFSMD